VLSILDPDWPEPAAFQAYGEHHRLELRFHDEIEETPGLILPREEHVARLLAFGREMMSEPSQNVHLLVHCHADVSRSTASMILILAQACPRLEAAAVAQEVFRIRPIAWPDLRIVEMGGAMLGRRGDLLTAVSDIYRAQLQSRPNLATLMTEARRGREVALGRERARSARPSG
jgi:predicted protein tyrosine phosphatase